MTSAHPWSSSTGASQQLGKHEKHISLGPLPVSGAFSKDRYMYDRLALWCC